MKKIYFFFILIPCICNSQVKIDAFDEDKKSSDSPSILNYDTAHAYKSFDENLRISAIMMPTQWSLFYEHNEDKYSPHKNSEISDAITTSKKISGLNQQYAKYAALIFKELDLIGDELGVFISNNDRLPFSIYKFPIDNQNLLFIDGATSDDVFNILKLTSKQRSARIVSSKLLPALKMI